MRDSQLTSVELFTGAGGLALGIAAAGFEHRLLVEYNADACDSLRENREAFGGDACTLYEGDVRGLDFRRYAGTDLLAAGAPCQPFSIGGKHKAHRDERNLFPQVFRAAREIRPRAIVVENVKGLLRSSLAEFVEFIELQLAHPLVLPSDALDPDGWRTHLPHLRRVHFERSDSTELQYVVRHQLLNAADFGVPQKRERVFFVAIRKDLGVDWQPPAATHSNAALTFAKQVTAAYWKAHGIKRCAAPSHALAGKWLREGGRSLPWATVRDALADLPEPLARRETPGVLNHVGQPGARSYPGHTGSPLDEPAKTLKAGVHGVPGGENMMRRLNGSVRYFTVREAARLQTFPDNYAFKGAWGEAMRQIGNAVPVGLAKAVASSVRRCLEFAALEAQAVSAHRAQRLRRQPEYVQAELSGLDRSA